MPRPGATSPGLPNRRQGLLLGERPARCPRTPAPATSRYVHSAGPVGGGSRSRFQKSLCTEVPELPSARWGDCPSGVRGSGCWELKLPYPGAWVKWPEEGREQLGLVPDRWAGGQEIWSGHVLVLWSPALVQPAGGSYWSPRRLHPQPLQVTLCQGLEPSANGILPQGLSK